VHSILLADSNSCKTAAAVKTANTAAAAINTAEQQQQ